MAGYEEGCQCPWKGVGGDHVRVCDPTPAETLDACYEMKAKTALKRLRCSIIVGRNCNECNVGWVLSDKAIPYGSGYVCGEFVLSF
jgi:hypothetical protein